MIQLVLGIVVAAGLQPAPEPPARNVILLIADGTGFTSYEAAAMYDGRLGKEIFNGPGWSSSAMSTYCLRTVEKPLGTGIQDPNVVYDPAKAWDKQTGYQWLKDTPTDSGASATAYSTGSKTYKHSICWSDLDKPMTNINDQLIPMGRSVGVVTTVEWSDATPAGMVAHNRNRENHTEIAREMVEKSGVTVIMGAGHPWYDGSGKRRAKFEGADWVGERDYFTTPIKTWDGIRIISSKQDFQDLADGKLDMMGCKRLVGTAEAGGAIQLLRAASKDWNGDGKIDGGDQKASPPYGDPLNQTVPTLDTMALGALNILNQNPKGFFAMIEGGAVDTSNHFNWPGRMIEEATSFFRTVETVSKWVEKHGGWKKNLVIVTTDHECGFVLGPDSDKIPFQPIVDNGKGKMPGLRHNHGNHTNALVPIYAKGPGSELLSSFATKSDPVRGKYLDNVNVNAIIQHALGIAK